MKAITVRLNEEEHANIKKYTAENNMSLNEFFVFAANQAMRGKMSSKVEENSKIKKTEVLCRLTNEVNELARRIGTEPIKKILVEVEELWDC